MMPHLFVRKSPNPAMDSGFRVSLRECSLTTNCHYRPIQREITRRAYLVGVPRPSTSGVPVMIGLAFSS